MLEVFRKNVLENVILALYLGKIAANPNCFPLDLNLVVVTLLNYSYIMKKMYHLKFCKS